MKKLWAKLNMTNFIKYQFSPVKDFFQKRKEAFFPGPVNFVAKELYKLERDFLKASPNFLETLVTTILIFTIIVGAILAIGKKHSLKHLMLNLILFQLNILFFSCSFYQCTNVFRNFIHCTYQWKSGGQCCKQVIHLFLNKFYDF